MNTSEMTQQRKHSRISKHSKMIIVDTRDSLSYSISCFFDETTNEKTSKAHVRDNLCSFSVASKNEAQTLRDVPSIAEY